MWWEIIYDVIYLFDVVALLASTMVYVLQQYVKPAVSLMLVICIPTITEHLVVAVQPHHFNWQSQCNQLGAFTKSW